MKEFIYKTIVNPEISYEAKKFLIRKLYKESPDKLIRMEITKAILFLEEREKEFFKDIFKLKTYLYEKNIAFLEI